MPQITAPQITGAEYNLECYENEIESLVMKCNADNIQLSQTRMRSTFLALFTLIPTDALISSRTCDYCSKLCKHPLPIGLCGDCEKKLENICGDTLEYVG